MTTLCAIDNTSDAEYLVVQAVKRRCKQHGLNPAQTFECEALALRKMREGVNPIKAKNIALRMALRLTEVAG